MTSPSASERLFVATGIGKEPAGLFSLALTLALFGCASPGVPRPPSLHLPAPVTGLTAQRVGDRVHLQWTAPTRTTDGLDLTIPTTVEICRDPLQKSSPPPATVAPCSPVLTLAGHAGVSTATDRLPPALTSTSGDRPLIAYRVRVLNPGGRSAPPSVATLVPGGPAPSQVAGFRATQERAGVVLEWRKAVGDSAPENQPDAIEILRTSQTSPSGEGLKSAPPNGGKQAKKRPANPFSRAQPNDSPADVRLRQASEDSIPSARKNPARMLDGMIDRSAAQGAVYVYTAQSVLTVTRAGQTLEIRSEPTAVATVAMRDTFPPAAPQGLVSIPGIVPPSSPGAVTQVTIDLAWDPNTETDLAGYLVYRSDRADGPPNGSSSTRLTPSPIPGSAYRDATALPGHRYLYRVTAVDRNGNESASSAPVEDTPDGR